ncbi:hypothetical protein [Roseateles albus]|uniref:Uncharacterized protein n=1 Tax=Roseateles albus TaxID=2987525 RepID=A0ABT5K9A9_9BURK|nr:hypothetical protein [Roseateles albus]MDC8770408.1 hypothetical protein [Roseateles albus]
MTPIKLRIASGAFGGLALFILLLLWASRQTLSLHGGLFWIGASLNFLIFALEPARLFGPAFGERMQQKPLTAALNAMTTLLWLLAGLAWLLAQF